MTKSAERPTTGPEYDFDPNASYHEVIYSEDWKTHRSPAYHEYRRLWDAIPRSKTALDFPLHFDIETTNICNLRCPMCPRTHYVAEGDPNYADPSLMSRDDFASIIDQGTEHGLKSIKLNYLSEPLAHKDVAWQVAYAKKKGVIDVMMNTNAALLRKEVGQALLDAGLDDLFVSFDAISPNLYEQQRVGASLGKVIDNLYEFTKLKKQKYPHVQVRVSMIMYKDPQWIEQFEGLKTMWKHMVDAVGFGYYTETDTDKIGKYPEVRGFWCAQPFQRMFMKNNGNVTTCCFDPKDEVVAGNWRKEKLFDIWNGPKYAEIRGLHASGEYYKMGICQKCHLPHAE